jgi:hypothetical protein
MLKPLKDQLDNMEPLCRSARDDLALDPESVAQGFYLSWQRTSVFQIGIL